MGSLFGGSPQAAPVPAPAYVPPPAPGTLVQTVLSGSGPGARLAPGPAGETDEQRRQRLANQYSILGGGLTGGGGDAGASGSASDGTGSGAGNGDGTGGSGSL